MRHRIQEKTWHLARLLWSKVDPATKNPWAYVEFLAVFILAVLWFFCCVRRHSGVHDYVTTLRLTAILVAIIFLTVLTRTLWQRRVHAAVFVAVSAAWGILILLIPRIAGGSVWATGPGTDQ